MIASVVQVQWVARMKNEGLEATLSLSLETGRPPYSYCVQAAGLD